MSKTAGKYMVEHNVTEKCFIVGGLVGNRTNFSRREFANFVKLGYKMFAFNLENEELSEFRLIIHDLEEIGGRMNRANSYWSFFVNLEDFDKIASGSFPVYRHIYSASELDGIQNENARKYMLENYARYPALYETLDSFEWVDPENFDKKSDIGWRGRRKAGITLEDEKRMEKEELERRINGIEKSISETNPISVEMKKDDEVSDKVIVVSTDSDVTKKETLVNTKEKSPKKANNKKCSKKKTKKEKKPNPEDLLTWKTIQLFRGKYEASETGIIRTVKMKCKVHRYRKSDGYNAVKITDVYGDGEIECRVCDLVKSAYGKIPDSYSLNDSEDDAWRNIDGFGGDYSISSKGLVRSFKKAIPKYMKLFESENIKAKYVNLSKDGIVKTHYVENLVYMNFPELYEEKKRKIIAEKDEWFDMLRKECDDNADFDKEHAVVSNITVGSEKQILWAKSIARSLFKNIGEIDGDERDRFLKNVEENINSSKSAKWWIDYYRGVKNRQFVAKHRRYRCVV